MQCAWGTLPGNANLLCKAYFITVTILMYVSEHITISRIEQGLYFAFMNVITILCLDRIRMEAVSRLDLCDRN